MAKRRVKPRRAARKKSSRAGSKSAISRYEYTQLCLELERVGSVAARNRTELDIQLRRIAQLQEELDTLKKKIAAPSSPFAS